MRFHLVNQKGLFSTVSWVPIITEHALEHLQAMLDRLDRSSEQSQACCRAIAWLSALPSKTTMSWRFFQSNDHAFKKDAAHRIPIKVIAWVQEPFKAIPPNPRDDDDQPKDPDPATWGWEHVTTWPHVAKDLLVLTNFIQEHDAKISCYAQQSLQQSFRQSQHLRNKTWHIRMPDVQRDVASTETFAVYVKESANEGYINKMGNLSTLGSALLFATPQAALQYTKRNKKFGQSAAIVKVSMAIENIDPIHTPAQPLPQLDAGLALMTREKIKQGLEHASHEQLQERLRALEAAPQEASSSKPRRM